MPLKENFKELYTDLVEKAAIAIGVDDVDGNILFINEEAARIHGYTVEEMKQMNIQLLIYPDDIPKTIEYHESRIAGKNPPSRYEFRGLKRDGSIIHLEAIVTAQKKGGKIVGTRSYLWDITQRKNTEEDLRHTLNILRKSTHTLIDIIGNILELRDPYTADHHHRVSDLARAIAYELDLPRDQIDGIRIAGLVHDIGKISVPAEILSKPSRLTETEMALIRTHPGVSHDLLKGIDFPWPVAQTVLQHHERIDGSGYPAGLKNDEIIFEAKILAVADVVEAMSSHRPYRPSRGIDKALEEISKNKGVLYDIETVDACLNIFEKGGFTFRKEAGSPEGPGGGPVDDIGTS
jgi:PAS domain S-box-containing protein